jgi:hypothetical protein
MYKFIFLKLERFIECRVDFLNTFFENNKNEDDFDKILSSGNRFIVEVDENYL